MSNLDRFSQIGEINPEHVPFLDDLPERFSASVFAVRQENTWARGNEGLEPTQQVALTGMAAQTAESVNRRANRYLFAEDGDRWLAVHNHPPQGAVPLVSHEQHGGPWSGKIVPKMMQDAPARTHTRPGHDHAGALDVVEGS